MIIQQRRRSNVMQLVLTQLNVRHQAVKVEILTFSVTPLFKVCKSKNRLFILHDRLVKFQIWEFRSSDVLKPFK